MTQKVNRKNSLSIKFLSRILLGRAGEVSSIFKNFCLCKQHRRKLPLLKSAWNAMKGDTRSIHDFSIKRRGDLKKLSQHMPRPHQGTQALKREFRIERTGFLLTLWHTAPKPNASRILETATGSRGPFPSLPPFFIFVSSKKNHVPQKLHSPWLNCSQP